MGNLFYRHVSPDVIEAMTYHKMKYWNDWHDIMVKEERKAIEAKRNA